MEAPRSHWPGHFPFDVANSVATWQKDNNVDSEEFRSVLAQGHERENIEFKAPGPCSRGHLIAKVVRAMMGMANRRDGGSIIVGVNDEGSSLDPVGIPETDRQSWTHDALADQAARYSEPSIDFELVHFEYKGANFVEVRVREFDDIPVISKGEFPNPGGGLVLRRGGLYVRSRHKVETSEVSSHEDMRALVDLAVDKGVARFVERARSAGLSLFAPDFAFGASPAGLDRFADEVNKAIENELAGEIQSRGHWLLIVRPVSFVEDRIESLGNLVEYVERAHVSVRGWDFPHIHSNDPVERGQNWVGQTTDWSHFREFWRIYQSGQFVALKGIPEDWRDRSEYWPAPDSWQPGIQLPVVDTIFTLTEAFLFASRIAITDASEELMHIEIVLGGTAGRTLFLDHNRRFGFIHTYQSAADEIRFSRDFPRDELVARPRELARLAAMFIFDRFSWNPTEEQLQSIQDELGR